MIELIAAIVSIIASTIQILERVCERRKNKRD